MSGEQELQAQQLKPEIKEPSFSHIGSIASTTSILIVSSVILYFFKILNIGLIVAIQLILALVSGYFHQTTTPIMVDIGKFVTNAGMWLKQD